MSADALHLSNPAGRLFLLLQHCQREATKTTAQKQILLRSVLTDYFGVDVNDRPAYFANVASVIAMPVQIRTAIAALDRPPVRVEYLLRPIGVIEEALPLIAGSRVSAKQFVDSLTGGTLSELEACSDVLANASHGLVVTQDSLDTIRDLATQILDELANDADLTKEFREEIRVHAQRIATAVSMYKIHGADAIREEFDTLTGVLVRNGEEGKRLRDHPVFRTIARLARMVLTTVAYAHLGVDVAESMTFFGELTNLPTDVEAPGKAQNPA